MDNNKPTIDGQNESQNLREEENITTSGVPNDMNNQNSNIQDENTQNKKKNVIGIALIALVVLLLVIGLAYKTISNNPTNVLKDSINNAYKDFKDELKEYDKKKKDFDITKDSVKVNGDLQLSGNMFKDIENDKISFTAGLDYANKLLEGEATLEENGKKLLNATAWSKDNKLYIKSNNLFDNTYEIDDFNFDEEFDLEDLKKAMEEMDNISTDDIDFIVKEFKNALIKSLNKDEMTKEKETIEINDLSVKATKISYNVDENSTKELMTSLADILTENNEFISKLAKLTNSEKNDIKDTLKELKNNDNYKNMPKGEINIYTTGVTNKVVKFELKLDTITLSYSDYKDNVYALLSEKNSDMKIEVIGKTEKKVTNIEIKYNKEKIATLTVRQFDEEGIDFDYNIEIKDEVKAEGTVKITCKEKSKTEYEGVIEFSINAEVDNEKVDFGAKINYTIKTKEKIAEYDTNNAKTFNDINEADTQKLQKALEDLENSNIYSFIEKMDLGNLFNNTNENNTFDIYDDDKCWNAYYKATYEDKTWNKTYPEYYDEHCKN